MTNKFKPLIFVVFFTCSTLLFAFGDLMLNDLGSSAGERLALFLCVVTGTALLPLAETHVNLSVCYLVGMAVVIAGHVEHGQAFHQVDTRQLIFRSLGTLLIIFSLALNFRKRVQPRIGKDT